MPPIMLKRGRPKGHEVTVIGLPAKKSKGKQAGTDHRERVIPFLKLHSSVKERGIYTYLRKQTLYAGRAHPLAALPTLALFVHASHSC